MEHNLKIKTLFVHYKEIESPLLAHIKKAHPDSEVVLVKANTYTWDPKHGNVSADYRDHFREKYNKAALLHRAAKWVPDPNGNSTDFLPGQMMTQGCGFGCTYCYTERHYVNNYPKLYADVYNLVPMIQGAMDNISSLREKMISLTHRDFERHRDPIHGDWITFDLGCDSDCTLDNQMTAHEGFHGHVVDIMNQVSKIPGAMTSFATKSIAFDRFLEGIERPSHHRIRLSLMPEHHRKVLEISTASTIDRLHAVNKLVDKGFQVHINLSPIVVTDNYVQEYQDLLKLVDNTLTQKAKDQMAYEVIYLTHTEKQFPMVEAYAPKAHKMMAYGPLPLVPKPNKKHVLSYSNQDKKWLKTKLREMITEITPYARVRYCY